MKKSTILIVCAVFILSVLVVGIFGLKASSYTEQIPVEVITILGATCSTDSTPIVLQGDTSSEATLNTRAVLTSGMYFDIQLAYTPEINTTSKYLNSYVVAPSLVYDEQQRCYVNNQGEPVVKLEGTKITFYDDINVTIRFQVDYGKNPNCILHIKWR